MTSEGLADLEADYRKVVSSICGVPTSPQVCFGKGGVAPRVVFVLGLPNGVHPLDAEGVKESSPNFARRCNLNRMRFTSRH